MRSTECPSSYYYYYIIVVVTFRARLTTEECLDHRWLMLHQSMVKARKSTVFATDKLRYFLDDYAYRRMRAAQLPGRLVDAYGAAAADTFAYDEDEYFASRRMSVQ